MSLSAASARRTPLENMKCGYPFTDDPYKTNCCRGMHAHICGEWHAHAEKKVEQEENAEFLLEFMASFADALPNELELQDWF